MFNRFNGKKRKTQKSTTKNIPYFRTLQFSFPFQIPPEINFVITDSPEIVQAKFNQLWKFLRDIDPPKLAYLWEFHLRHSKSLGKTVFKTTETNSSFLRKASASFQKYAANPEIGEYETDQTYFDWNQETFTELRDATTAAQLSLSTSQGMQDMLYKMNNKITQKEQEISVKRMRPSVTEEEKTHMFSFTTYYASRMQVAGKLHWTPQTPAIAMSKEHRPLFLTVKEIFDKTLLDKLRSKVSNGVNHHNYMMLSNCLLAANVQLLDQLEFHFRNLELLFVKLDPAKNKK